MSRMRTARLLFSCIAPAILTTIKEHVDYYEKEIARLRIIARDAAFRSELWLWSKHRTWRFFQVIPDSLAGIDRGGKPVLSGQTIA